MKRTIGIMMTALLLLAVTGAKADNYKGTLERHGVKMEYAFSGGTVTKKSKPVVGGAPYAEMFVPIEGEVKPGSTVTASCKKLTGLATFKEVTITTLIHTNDGQVKQDIKKGSGSCSASISIPSNATKVSMSMSYRSWRTKLTSEITWNVVKEGRPTTTTPTAPGATTTESQTGGTYKGTINRQGMTLEYTIKGVKMIRKEKPTYMGNNPKEGNYFQDYWVAVSSGQSVTVSCKKVKGKKDPIIMIEAKYSDHPGAGGGRIIDTNTMPRDKEKTETTVVQKKEFGQISISYLGDTGDWITVTYHFNIDGHMDSVLNETPSTTTPSTTTAGNFNWKDIAPDENCPVCKKPFSGYEVLHVNGSVGQRCKDGHGNFASMSALEPYYFYDYIVTKSDGEVTLFYGDQENTVTVKPNSTVICAPLANGNSRWYVHKGAIVGQHLKHVDKVRPTLQLTNCTAYPKGTVYVAEDDGKVSRVYLLSGAMDVTSTKTNKKVTLKPGQAATVSADGQQKVQAFDVKKLAKKYGIKTSATTTPAADQGRISAIKGFATKFVVVNKKFAVMNYPVTYYDYYAIYGKKATPPAGRGITEVMYITDTQKKNIAETATKYFTGSTIRVATSAVLHEALQRHLNIQSESGPYNSVTKGFYLYMDYKSYQNFMKYVQSLP